MNAIIEHLRTQAELARKGIHGFASLTADALELLPQKDEAALRRANTRLEQRVRARTAELTQTNAALQAEVHAHKLVEHEGTQLLVRERALRRELEAAPEHDPQPKDHDHRNECPHLFCPLGCCRCSLSTLSSRIKRQSLVLWPQTTPDRCLLSSC